LLESQVQAWMQTAQQAQVKFVSLQSQLPKTQVQHEQLGKS
jgi:hypothetical protein